MRYPLARRAPLAHPLRAAILRHVAAHPGLTASALAAQLGSDWKTVAHHVDVLSQLGHLDSREDGRRRRFFPREGCDAAKRVVAATTLRASASLLGLVLERPGLTVHELGAALGAPVSTTRWHLARLARHGLVAPAGAGWAVPPAARPGVREVLGKRGPAGG